jgi:hypothetical protein
METLMVSWPGLFGACRDDLLKNSVRSNNPCFQENNFPEPWGTSPKDPTISVETNRACFAGIEAQYPRYYTQSRISPFIEDVLDNSLAS